MKTGRLHPLLRLPVFLSRFLAQVLPASVGFIQIRASWQVAQCVLTALVPRHSQAPLRRPLGRHEPTALYSAKPGFIRSQFAGRIQLRAHPQILIGFRMKSLIRQVRKRAREPPFSFTHFENFGVPEVGNRLRVEHFGPLLVRKWNRSCRHPILTGIRKSLFLEELIRILRLSLRPLCVIRVFGLLPLLIRVPQEIPLPFFVVDFLEPAHPLRFGVFLRFGTRLVRARGVVDDAGFIWPRVVVAQNAHVQSRRLPLLRTCSVRIFFKITNVVSSILAKRSKLSHHASFFGRRNVRQVFTGLQALKRRIREGFSHLRSPDEPPGQVPPECVIRNQQIKVVPNAHILGSIFVLDFGAFAASPVVVEHLVAL